VSETSIQICNKLGLHARAAARFVHLANRFSSRIYVAKTGTRVDGKSILGLLTLAASQGTRLVLIADGEDEQEALRQLAELVHNGFDEDS